ncbi:hypothetical protein EYF80_054893 [Liparis tanakae]|uniref:Uncharacterized protein n=1 Tax=Liparis tanakae TaxID=230148 RepID=A0A4Z2F1D4_9TELE|nr:hypothetical protein EYF80_054893 [Liparis tanakae]
MLMDGGVVGDGHHVELAVLHGAAGAVQVHDGGELAAVLAQEQLHVRVAVVAKLLRLEGRTTRGGRRGAEVAGRFGLGGVGGVGGVGGGGDGRTIGGRLGGWSHSDAPIHRRQVKQQQQRQQQQAAMKALLAVPSSVAAHPGAAAVML